MIDLDNPIFTLYFNVDGLSRQRAEENIEEFLKYYAKNLNVICFPVKGGQETKMDVLWRGNDIEKQISESSGYKVIKDKINIILKLVEDGVSDDLIKQKIRNMQLKEILE